MNKRTHNKLRRAVTRGADFLDGRRPSWFTKINTANLALDDCGLCVLGQLYATSNDEDGYARGLTLLNGAVAKDPERFGFYLDGWDSEGEMYAAITEMWREEVALRRRARRAAA